MKDLVIREERPGDFEAIQEVNRLAFGRNSESQLVDRLRADGLFVVSLVAIEEDKIIGHILFTKLPIETGSAVIRAAALAPVSVAPLRQRQGIGSTLVRKGIDACFKRGVNVVIVVGHLDYYPRFGFSAEKAKCISSKYSGPHFMALELTPHILDGIVGKVRYPAAFSEVD